MSFRKRIKNVEKLLPAVKQVDDVDREQVSEWLVQNCEEFRECIRQLFRLQCKINNTDEKGDGIQEQYREQANAYMNRINDLIELNKGSVSI